MEDEIDQPSGISLVGMSVWQRMYGQSIITRKEVNKIHLRTMGKIVEMLAEYSDLDKKLAEPGRQVDRLVLQLNDGIRGLDVLDPPDLLALKDILRYNSGCKLGSDARSLPEAAYDDHAVKQNKKLDACYQMSFQ